MGASPTTDSVRRAYAVLGLTPGVSASMIRAQYLLLAKRWHPDKCAIDEANQAYAAEKMREINCGYQLLQEHAADSAWRLPEPPRTAVPKAGAGNPGGWDSSRNEEVIQAILGRRQRDVSFSIGRIISLVIAAVYLFIPVASRDGGQILQVLKFLVTPLACIWYGDEMGSYVGGRITRSTPGVVVRIGGWFLLFLPILLGAIAVLSAR